MRALLNEIPQTFHQKKRCREDKGPSAEERKLFPGPLNSALSTANSLGWERRAGSIICMWPSSWPTADCMTAVVSRIVPTRCKARFAIFLHWKFLVLGMAGEPQYHCRWKDQEACGRADHTTESRRPFGGDCVALRLIQKDRNTDLHYLAEGFCILAKFLEPGDPGWWFNSFVSQVSHLWNGSKYYNNDTDLIAFKVQPCVNALRTGTGFQ